MARLHTRKHGRSKSRKPMESEAKTETGREEIEKEIVAYAKQGMKGAMIGQKLKDEKKAGYLKPLLGKRLNVLLEEKGFKSDIPADLLDLMRKAVNLRKHLTANHRDVHNTTRLHRVESKIWRLGKYYRKSGRLPVDWKYDPEQAALIIKQA
jgi:small subunit ribosomal protein S15